MYGRQTQIPTRMNTKSPIMNWKMPSMVIVAVSTLQIHLFHCLVYNLVVIIQYLSVLWQDHLMYHKKWNPPNVPSTEQHVRLEILVFIFDCELALNMPYEHEKICSFEIEFL